MELDMSLSDFDLLCLSDVSTYVKEKVKSTELSTGTYVSTENMLPNKAGLIDATKVSDGRHTRFDINDVLISNIRPYFKKIWFADKVGGCSTDVLVFRNNKKITPKYLYYSLLDDQFFNYMMSGSKGTKMPRGDKAHIMDYELLVPNLNKQVSITSILSSIDDKIEINNKINKTLEELAQTLYKHWFVDFEFPNEEGKSYKSSGGEMVESEFGNIPKGWNVTYLDDLFDFERGIEPGSKNYSETKTEGHIPFIRVGDLESTPKIYVDTSLVKDKTCKPDDVMVSFDGAIGRVGIGLSGAYSTGIRKVTSKNNDIGFSFIYGLVKSQNIQDQILTYANGTTILHAGSSIKHLVMPFNLGAVLKLEQILQPLMKKILNNFDENRNLEALRDTLLPRLMSGEIEV
jgi:type I restriction enzyme, S subunit